MFAGTMSTPTVSAHALVCFNLNSSIADREPSLLESSPVRAGETSPWIQAHAEGLQRPSYASRVSTVRFGLFHRKPGLRGCSVGIRAEDPAPETSCLPALSPRKWLENAPALMSDCCVYVLAIDGSCHRPSCNVSARGVQLASQTLSGNAKREKGHFQHALMDLREEYHSMVVRTIL
jgi:hypothetical protein